LLVNDRYSTRSERIDGELFTPVTMLIGYNQAIV